MKYYFFIILMSITNFVIMGQVHISKGFVVDAETGKPLSYANIVVLNNNIGTTSDSYGHFTLFLNKAMINDTLVISYVGYKSKKISVNEIDNTTIRLTPQMFFLESISVTSPGRRKEITLNKFRPRDCFVPNTNEHSVSKDYFIPYRPEEPTIEAIYFPFEDAYSRMNYIKKVIMYLKSFSLPSSYRLRILKASIDSHPGEDLLTENIIIKVTEKDQMVEIDLEEFNLFFPENGLFIGFELLVIPENQYQFNFPDGSETYTQYSPFLQYFDIAKPEYKSWIYTKGGWTDHQRKIEWSKRDTKYLTPAISLVLTE